jgi:hypothetical protein
MPSFLIETPHTQEDCLKAIEYVLAAGYITHFHWGCKTGDHTGYAILDAKDKAEALMVVPTLGRPRARVMELTQFSPAEIKAMHDKR